MHKKHKIEEEENKDRWVVSYADFITLLFAFFTTMYAISHVDLGKLERFSGSMESAFKTSSEGDIGKGTVISGIKPINYADVGLEKDVLTELGKFGIIQDIAVVRDQRGVLISFGDFLFFGSGSAELRRESRPFLSSIATLIKKYHRDVLIEGHTDNLPVHNSHYSSNIELASSRASHVYSFLVSEEGVDASQMGIAGYGEYRPVESNATPEGRARNRRIDIVFVSKKNGT
ncbi:MAG TPA: OmpA family protein [Nitrospirota bacterium]|nr:OmpA family protein [Nitrospirota bacterium]